MPEHLFSVYAFLGFSHIEGVQADKKGQEQDDTVEEKVSSFPTGMWNFIVNDNGKIFRLCFPQNKCEEMNETQMWRPVLFLKLTGELFLAFYGFNKIHHSP